MRPSAFQCSTAFLILLSVTSSNADQFSQIYLPLVLGSKFVIKMLLKIMLYIKYVTTLLYHPVLNNNNDDT